jgi:hypothetical protein
MNATRSGNVGKWFPCMLVVSEKKVQASTMCLLPVTDVGQQVETRSSYVVLETSRGRLKQQAETEARGRSSALIKHSGCHIV